MKPANRTNLVAPAIPCLSANVVKTGVNTVAFQRKIVPIRPIMPANRIQFTR
jgi:hypothetical protein